MPKKSQEQKDAENRSTGGLFVSLILGVFSIVLGFVLGVFNLSIIPVETVSKLPDVDDRTAYTVYYVQPRGHGGAAYKEKEQALLNDTKASITLTAADLNAWASNTFRFAKPDEGERAVTIMPAAPKFNIEGGTINMSVTVEVEFGEKTRKVLFQTQGTFQQLAGDIVFVPEETYLGSARLPKQLIAPLISDQILKMFESAEQSQALLEAWSDLTDVRVDGKRLTLVKG